MSRPKWEQASVKLDWAEKHIRKLEAAIHENFREVNPDPIGREPNLQTGEVTYYLKHLPPVHDTIPLIAGDVLHSLRGALDYIACGMVLFAGGSVTRRTKFPIAPSAKDCEPLVRGLIPGLCDDAFEAIKRVQPYNGGNTHLWHLHRLNNRDKHELLLTMGFIYVGRGLTPSEKTTAQVGRPSSSGKSYIVGKRVIPPFTLHAGQELLTVAASEAEENVNFRFDVALNEPGIPEGFTLTLELMHMRLAVEMALNELRRFCE